MRDPQLWVVIRECYQRLEIAATIRLHTIARPWSPLLSMAPASKRSLFTQARDSAGTPRPPLTASRAWRLTDHATESLTSVRCLRVFDMSIRRGFR